MLLFQHDLLGKPVPALPDHALSNRPPPYRFPIPAAAWTGAAQESASGLSVWRQATSDRWQRSRLQMRIWIKRPLLESVSAMIFGFQDQPEVARIKNLDETFVLVPSGCIRALALLKRKG
jgi:hypothetical protein